MKTKEKIISELDSRIEKLKNRDEKSDEKNPYGKMNQALSCLLNEVLTKELTDLRDFVDKV